MINLFADFETLYSDTYSLKKMTPAEYILNPQFEALGCAFQVENGMPFWVDGPDLPSYFANIDWANTNFISHNALFDALILSLHYKIRPAHYGCTLSMARNWLSHEIGSVSLASCAERYGLPAKMDTLKRMKGINFLALTQDPMLYAEVKTYGKDDVTKCNFIYNKMLEEGFPPDELDVVDWVIRMAAIPQLELDANVVADHLGQVQADKQALLDAAGLDSRDPLMRDEVLAAGLMMLGVDVPRKVSKTTGKEAYAFAKTDKAFTDLLEHDDPRVQALVAARLGHKSTLEETRAGRFLSISQVTKDMPVPLRYSGAHTHRFSGDWSLNLQNLPNGGKLRFALRAPKGCVVVSVDASQIEARINAVVSGETWLVNAFAENRDVYCDFAGMIYNRPIVKALDKVERFIGKTAILSLGYGSSWPVFQNMCRVKGDIRLTDASAAQIVDIYRNKCPAINAHWTNAKQVIQMIAKGNRYFWGPLEVGFEKLILPNGNALRYRGLRQEMLNDRWQWVYDRGKTFHKLYGAKVVENECQALAFVHIAEVAMRVMKQTDRLLWPVHQVHDELIYVVPEKLAEQVKNLVVSEMSTPPQWLPLAPLAAEGRIGDSYGAAH